MSFTVPGLQEMSDIQQEADEVTEILNTYCRQEALGRDGESVVRMQRCLFFICHPWSDGDAKIVFFFVIRGVTPRCKDCFFYLSSVEWHP